MMYDAAPEDMNAEDHITLKNYKEVLAEVEKIIPKEKIYMGFEPGPQYNGGVWEGTDVDVDVIDYLKTNGYGGVMFWAVNEATTGANVNKLATYAKEPAK